MRKQPLALRKRMIEEVTIVGWLAVVTTGRWASSSIRMLYLLPRNVRRLAGLRLLASQLPGASVAPRPFTRSRFPTLFRRTYPRRRSRYFLHGVWCADGSAAWPVGGSSADISRRPTLWPWWRPTDRRLATASQPQLLLRLPLAPEPAAVSLAEPGRRSERAG